MAFVTWSDKERPCTYWSVDGVHKLNVELMSDGCRQKGTCRCGFVVVIDSAREPARGLDTIESFFGGKD